VPPCPKWTRRPSTVSNDMTVTSSDSRHSAESHSHELRLAQQVVLEALDVLGQTDDRVAEHQGQERRVREDGLSSLVEAGLALGRFGGLVRLPQRLLQTGGPLVGGVEVAVGREQQTVG